MFKITLIGDASVGKSSLLLRYIDNVFEESYICTVGVDFKLKTMRVDGEIVKLQIWDTAGQERFKPITHCYFRGSHGSIVVMDITNRESFENVAVWVEDFRENNAVDCGRNIVIVGNKLDEQESRVVSYEEAHQKAQELNCEYVEASAMTGKNLDVVFEKLVRLVVGSIKDNRAASQTFMKGKRLSEEKAKKRGCCS